MRTAASIGVAKKPYDDARKPENQRRIKHAVAAGAGAPRLIRIRGGSVPRRAAPPGAPRPRRRPGSLGFGELAMAT